jgi:hypothetical protein
MQQSRETEGDNSKYFSKHWVVFRDAKEDSCYEGSIGYICREEYALPEGTEYARIKLAE